MNGRPGKFERGALPDPSLEGFRRRVAGLGIAEDEVRRQHAKLLRDEIWVSPEYQVNVDRDPPHGLPGLKVVHLSIKRRDRSPVHDWRDLQAIKNALVGTEFEAIEVYPAESRLVDTANQYHLWVITDEAGGPVTFPVGWTSRLTMDEGKAGAVQRPPNDNENGN